VVLLSGDYVIPKDWSWSESLACRNPGLPSILYICLLEGT
jgi:hypothetical protein